MTGPSLPSELGNLTRAKISFEARRDGGGLDRCMCKVLGRALAQQLQDPPLAVAPGRCGVARPGSHLWQGADAIVGAAAVCALSVASPGAAPPPCDCSASALWLSSIAASMACVASSCDTCSSGRTVAMDAASSSKIAGSQRNAPMSSWLQCQLGGASCDGGGGRGAAPAIPFGASSGGGGGPDDRSNEAATRGCVPAHPCTKPTSSAARRTWPTSTVRSQSASCILFSNTPAPRSNNAINGASTPIFKGAMPWAAAASGSPSWRRKTCARTLATTHLASNVSCASPDHAIFLFGGVPEVCEQPAHEAFEGHARWRHLSHAPVRHRQEDSAGGDHQGDGCPIGERRLEGATLL